MRSLACWDCRFEFRRWHGCLSVVSVVCRQVEVSATTLSLVQRCPIESRVSQRDIKTAIMSRPTSGFAPWNKKLMYGKSKFSLHVCIMCMKYRHIPLCYLLKHNVLRSGSVPFVKKK